MPARSASPGFLVSVLAVLLLGPGCAYYSFTGATIQPHLATLAVPLADDRTVSTLTGLDERLTTLLVGRFVGQTRLSLSTDAERADAVLTATLQRYDNQPTSVSGLERATRNRVTVTVGIVYYDNVQKRDLLRRTFSAFEEYDPLIPAQEEDAALAALEKIADDVFTAATSNW